MSEQFVTARDLLANKFAITVHRSILERFAKAIRQRQVVLSQYGIPPEVISVIIPVTPSQEVPNPTLSKDFLQALAYCFYHFINFKFYESSRSTKLWEVSKDDFEDSKVKSVVCYVSKLTVCFNCLVIRATIGQKIDHCVLWCAPSGSFKGLLPAIDAPKPIRRLISTSDSKFLSSTDHRGTWAIHVDIRRPNTSFADTAFSAHQLSDVAEIVVSLKCRHELRPFQTSIMGKLPPAYKAADGDENVEEEEEEDSPVDNLFAAPIRFSTVRPISGTADPAPLPRNPFQYTLPADETTGPSLAPFKPWAPIPPRVLPPTPEAFTVTPLSVTGSQSTLRKKKDPFTLEEVQEFTQMINISLRILNITEKSQVFEPPIELLCLAEEGTATVTTPLLVSRKVKWDTQDGVLLIAPLACVVVQMQCEYIIQNCEPGDTFFERSLLPSVFPQPARFQATLSEAHTSQTATFEIYQYNADRETQTQEDYMAITHKSIPAEDVLLFASADDIKTRQRISASVVLDRVENRIVVARRNNSVYLPLQKLQFIAYQCLMSGQEEYQIPSFSDENCSAWCLLSQNAHPPMVYGIKVEIKTSSSTCIRSCYVKFPEPSSNWIASTEGSRQNSTSFTAPSTGHSVSSSVAASVAEARSAIIDSGVNRPFDAPKQPVSQQEDQINADTTSMTSQPENQRRVVPASMEYSIMYDTPIGSGAFGTVFKAFDRLNGRTVAVKESNIGGPIRGSGHRTTTTTSSSSIGSSDSERKEFDVLVKLSHPNIVKVFDMDFLKEANIFRVFMEWVPGGSVSSVISRGRFRLHENVVKAYARDALQGLAYLHNRNILHLDVKPHNMLVSHEGHVKLADFGTTLLLSQAMTSVSSHAVVGTPAYMAPEIITAGKYYRGSDIWAWAASVVEMASGHQPWHHLPEEIRINSLPLMFHIASAKSPNHAPLIPDHLSQDLKDILAACFSPSLSLRPSAESLLSNDYFHRETLPLDAEDLSAFYELSRVEQSVDSQTPTSEGSWTTVGTTF